MDRVRIEQPKRTGKVNDGTTPSAEDCVKNDSQIIQQQEINKLINVSINSNSTETESSKQDKFKDIRVRDVSCDLQDTSSKVRAKEEPPLRYAIKNGSFLVKASSVVQGSGKSEIVSIDILEF